LSWFSVSWSPVMPRMNRLVGTSRLFAPVVGARWVPRPSKAWKAGHRVAAPVETKREFVQVGWEVLVSDAHDASHPARSSGSRRRGESEQDSSRREERTFSLGGHRWTGQNRPNGPDAQGRVCCSARDDDDARRTMAEAVRRRHRPRWRFGGYRGYPPFEIVAPEPNAALMFRPRDS
jgi:hypothetical protein